MTCLPTDSKLEGLKNFNATENLLCEVDFVIHSARSILKLKKLSLVFTIAFGTHNYFSTDMTISANSEKPDCFNK